MTDATPLFTIVIAAYGRPEVLRCTLEGLRRQSVERWHAIVVGDACPHSGAVVEELADPRVRFVNLPTRQGEQSRPSSVGLALADTPYVALLNHDDIWLPDHLERLRTALDDGADICATSAAVAFESKALPDGTTRPVFGARTIRGRRLSDAFLNRPHTMEPASSWALTADLARRLGPWSAAVELHRAPWIDWLLRAWRLGATFHSDETITVLNVQCHNTLSGGSYARAADDHRSLVTLLDQLGADELRALVERDLHVHGAGRWQSVRWLAARVAGHVRRGTVVRHTRDAVRARAVVRRLRDPAASARFLETGEDLFDELAPKIGASRGARMRRQLEMRTGEALGAPTPLAELLGDCRRQLQAP